MPEGDMTALLVVGVYALVLWPLLHRACRQSAGWFLCRGFQGCLRCGCEMKDGKVGCCLRCGMRPGLQTRN